MLTNSKTGLLIKIILAVLVSLAALAYPGYSPNPATAQQMSRSQSDAGDMDCVSYCSPTRPRIELMEVKFRLANTRLNELQLRKEVAQEGLEVTVYNEGFERGLFATVPALRRNTFFRTQTKQSSPLPKQRKIPGLEKLVITDVGTRVDQPSKSLLLMEPSTEKEPEAEWVTVLLEGVEPGLAYSFRVPGQQSFVRCLAVVCPVDFHPAPKTRTRRRRS